MPEHKQVHIEHRGWEADVDEELVPLILEIWKHDIPTLMSCQENRPGIIWLCFPTVIDGERFLNLLVKYPDESELHIKNERLYVGDIPFWETLYSRVMQSDGTEDDWEYNVHPYDCGVEETINDKNEVKYSVTGPTDIVFSFSVRFPQTDMPELLRVLKELRRKKYNARLATRIKS